MKNSKRWIGLALAIIMCIGLLAGCNPPAPTPTPTQNVGGENTPAPGGENPPAPTPGGENPPAPPVADSYHESPYIATMGITAKVEDRLPKKDDIFVETTDAAGNPLSIGVYGGELKRSASSGTGWGAGKPIEEGLFRFNTNAQVEPNVAKSFEVNADATVYTIHLREGIKWSDGEPFTAEDCVWFYNVVCMNKLDSKGIRNCHKDSNGDPAKVEKVDDYTFTVTFGTPKYDFPEALTVDLKWHWGPKHIFEDMCNNMLAANGGDTDAEKKVIDFAKELCGVEFATVGDVGKQLLYYFWNYTGVPTLNPFVMSTEPGKNSNKGEYFEFIRNPYYWKTDAAGNQLPYIDKIIYQTVQNVDQELMLLLDGTVDYQTIAIEDAPTVLDAENTSGQKINLYQWSGVEWSSSAHQLQFNLFSQDETLRTLFNNPDFRQAVSISVDREAVADTLTNGWQEGGQAAPQAGTQGYSEEWAKKWTEYDVEKAKTLLESCGLTDTNGDGWRELNGNKFELNISAFTEAAGAATTYDLLRTYWDKVGLKTTFKDVDRSVIDNDIMAGAVNCMLFPVTPIGDISIALKPNSMIPGAATNVVWYGTMDKTTATGDLLKLIELKEELDKTADTAKRTEIINQMLKLHQDNQWTLGFIAGAPTIHAVNDRIKNFPDGLVWSDIYRDMGIAHCQVWYIQQ